MGTALIRPHPLSSRDQVLLPFPAGHSIADLARIFWPDEAVQRHVVAFIGDVRVPRTSWACVRPKEGAVVRLGLTCFEGGGDNSKGILALVATIALAIVAPYAAGAMGFTGTAATAVAAGITVAGSLAIAAIFKPPMIDVGTPSSNPADAQTYSITGQANSATPYGPMLRVYGQHRIFPRLAAVPFTVAEGPHQFLYMLLDCGYGPLAIDDLQIGDTPILNYRDVLYRIHPSWRAGDPLEIYRNDTSYENFSLVLTQGVSEFRTTAPDASGIVLDFALPRGLIAFDDRGNRAGREVGFDAYLRPASSGAAWQHVREFPVYSSHPSTADVTIGAWQTFPAAGRSIIKGTYQFILRTTAVQVGDTLYLASQEKLLIVAVEPGYESDNRKITTSAGCQGGYVSGVQSPVLHPTGATGQIVITDQTPSPIFFSLSIDVPSGSWEVQVVRRTAESTSDRVFDELAWTSIRSVADRPPVAVQDAHTLIELKIRASEQLSGVLQDVNCIATSILPVWDGNVPPPGAVHWDFLADALQPLYGADLAQTACTRPTSGTRVNALGLIETVAADLPRFDYDAHTKASRGLLVEEGRVNLCAQSNGFATTPWANGGASPVQNAIGPDGALSAWTLIDDNVGNFLSIYTAWTVANDSSPHTFAIFVKKTTGAAGTFAINFGYAGGTVPINMNPRLNTNSGVLVGAADYRVEDFSSEFWRISFTMTNNSSGHTTLNCAIYPASGTNVGDQPGPDDPAGVGSAVIFGAQLENAPHASSYIPTNGAATYRAPDLVRVADLSKFYNPAEGALLVECDTHAPEEFGYFACLHDGTSNEVFAIRKVSGSVWYVILDNGTYVGDFAASPIQRSVRFRFAAAYKAGDYAGTKDGAPIGATAYAAVPTGTTLDIGSFIGGIPVNGHICRFTYYPMRPTNAQLLAMSGTGQLGPDMWIEQGTRNPAWAFIDVLRGSGAIRPLADARIDFDALEHWADYCDAEVPNGVGGAPEPRVRFDHVVDYSTTTFQLLQSIAASGRATPAVRDGKHGVIVDEEQTLPVQLFTPRNSWGFNARRNYLNEPDALRVKFIDPENSWQEGNVVIYAAGKNAANSGTFEDLKLFGVTRYTQATRDGRYLKAQALLRREEFAISCDIENLIAARGDLVLVAHDVLKVGGESARIIAIAGNRITLSDAFGELPIARYGVRVRTADGTVTAPIEAVPIPPDAFDLSALPTPAPAPGDLIAWGFLQVETGEYLVKQIAPGDELTAQLTLAEVARDVYQADGGEIPAYSPPAGGRPVAGPGPAVLNLAVEQIDTTIGREPYCDLVLTWAAPQLGGYPKYRVYQISDAGVTTQIAETHLTRLEIARALRLLDPDVTSIPRTFGVIGIDAIGRQSEPAYVTFTPADPLQVPGDVQYLSSNAHDKTTTLTWFAPTDPAVPGNAQVQFFEVRWQPSGVPVWGTAGRVTELVPWNVTVVTVPSRNGAYLVKAITASGIESALPAITVIAVEDLVIQDFWATRRFAPAWDGVFDHVVVDGAGRLTLTTEPDGTFSPVGTFYSNDRQTFSELLQCRINSTLEASGLNNTLLMADWVPLALADPLAGAERGDWAASIWIAARDTAPYAMADWVPLASAVPLDPFPPIAGGDWRPLLHGEYIARDLRFAVVLESFKANVSPRVEQAGVDIDFPERAEEHADIVVPAAGLAFAFDRPFVFAPSVAIDLQDAAPGDFVDRGPVDQAGFSLTVRGASGTAKTGVVDVSAFGVGRTL